MSELRKAAERALKALDGVLDTYGEPLDLMTISGGTYEALECRDAITALRAALAQPDESFCDSHCTWHDHHPDCALAQPEQDPVAYLWQHGETNRTRIIERDQVWTANDQWNCVGPLYLHPPQRKPLTDDQIDAIVRSNVTITDQNLACAVYMSMRELEAAHGIQENE